MTDDFLVAKGSQEDPKVFEARFLRCCPLLLFIARRVLGGPERAQDAVESCWLSASRNPPRFEYEGAFRSWLVRVLIDQAVDILHKRREVLRQQVPAINA